MDTFKVLLYMHITGGFISLLIGLFILFLKKGDRIHILLGKVFYCSMLGSALISLPVAYLHQNYFLFIVGVFTSYMLIRGKAYLTFTKNLIVQQKHWFLSGLMLVFGLAFILFGINQLLKRNDFGLVFLVFGAISILFVYQDSVNYKGKSKFKNYWLTTHIQRMMGSYIASVTAFLLVNNTILNGTIAWLLPTLVLTPVLIFWGKKYEILKNPQ
jgi:uncharacterized membrane protein